MAPSGSPIVRRRRLAAELRRLRGDRTGGEVARGIGWSATKISRAESGHDSIPPEEVEKLLDYYGVTDPFRGQLLGLAQDAARRGWWDSFGGVLTPEYLEYVGLEAESVSISEWEADVVPGLLQTEDYARQIAAGYQQVMPTPPNVIEQVVRVRMLRQRRLAQEPVLQLYTVLDEAVLLRKIGDPGIMRRQLEHLAVTSERPNVDLRILPLNRDAPLAISSFSILNFGTRSTSDPFTLSEVVAAENVTSQFSFEGEANTYLFRVFHDALTRSALPPEDSLRWLRRTAADRWT
jgi:hypothetical protein